MQIKHTAPFSDGYEEIVGRSGPNADMLMDLGHLSLGEGRTWESPAGSERAFLLVSGSVKFSWTRHSGGEPTPAGRLIAAGDTAVAVRTSLFDENPTVLSVPEGFDVRIAALSATAELYVMATGNAKDFAPRLYLPGECRTEERGKGTMRETSTRIVRTVFDDSNAPHSNLVVGEVVGVPGRWSSYPPHHHPQPEIYHYRFLPEQGFGLTAIGNKAFMLADKDTILIRDGQDHPQVTAPGYAMWYLWVIRHLDGNRYGTPEFTQAHVWVGEPDADIWALPSERTNK